MNRDRANRTRGAREPIDTDDPERALMRARSQRRLLAACEARAQRYEAAAERLPPGTKRDLRLRRRDTWLKNAEKHRERAEQWEAAAARLADRDRGV